MYQVFKYSIWRIVWFGRKTNISTAKYYYPFALDYFWKFSYSLDVKNKKGASNMETKEKVVLFVKNHKSEIIAGIAVIACVCFIEKRNIANQKLINELMEDKTKSLKEISNLKEENQYLKSLCEVKDKFFDKAISESMRHGGSFGAQQMAFKRWENVVN